LINRKIEDLPFALGHEKWAFRLVFRPCTKSRIDGHRRSRFESEFADREHQFLPFPLCSQSKSLQVFAAETAEYKSNLFSGY
jgi:hypothetical protein